MGDQGQNFEYVFHFAVTAGIFNLEEMTQSLMPTYFYSTDKLLQLCVWASEIKKL